MSGSPASAWWKLLRAGNVFTAVSNVLAGFLLASGVWQPWLPLLLLVVASATLYLSGMVLNDVFDLEEDRVDRSERPLPAGDIPLRHARFVGWGLMFEGLSAAGVASWLLTSWLPLVVAILLALAILTYNIVLKKTMLAPFAMALCRALNVLLGASVVMHSSEKNAAYLYAAVLGIYTLGLTLLARNEITQSSEQKIKSAVYVVQLALLVMLLLAVFVTLPKFGWLALWLVCLLVIRVGLYDSVVDPTPAHVQKSVSRLITMFIPLDALACVAAGSWLAGLVVLALLVPTHFATRRAPMT